MKELLINLLIIGLVPISMFCLEPILGDYSIYAPYMVVGAIILAALLWNEINKSIAREKQKEIDKRLLASRPKNRNIPKYDWWLKNVEPKYSDSKAYGPDWGTRREYIADIYEHKCGCCGTVVPPRSGHVHHVDRLSTSGSNELNNLVFLCRHCHEDQHPHLKWKKELRLREIKRRGITEEQYLKEKRDAYFEWKREKAEMEEFMAQEFSLPSKNKISIPRSIGIVSHVENKQSASLHETKDNFADIDDW